jgi:hypothetical protein
MTATPSQGAVVIASSPSAAFVAASAQGIPGPGLNILGYYATLPLLQAAHPTGTAGDAWAVGTAVYYWGGSSWLTSAHLYVPLLEVSGPLDLELVMDDDVPGPGWPVCVSRANGHGRLARADTYALSFVAGLSKAATAAGFVCTLEGFALSLDDWTAVAGTPVLSAGAQYFLSPATGLGAADVSAVAVALVGTAASATTLKLTPNPPILMR